MKRNWVFAMMMIFSISMIGCGPEEEDETKAAVRETSTSPSGLVAQGVEDVESVAIPTYSNELNIDRAKRLLEESYLDSPPIFNFSVGNCLLKENEFSFYDELERAGYVDVQKPRMRGVPSNARVIKATKKLESITWDTPENPSGRCDRIKVESGKTKVDVISIEYSSKGRLARAEYMSWVELNEFGSIACETFSKRCSEWEKEGLAGSFMISRSAWKVAQRKVAI